MVPHLEATQLAFEMAADSIMAKGNFNAEIAMNSLRIFKNTIGSEDLSETAETVLDALDNLMALVSEGRRSRAWQDQKLVVQDAFSNLHEIYEKNCDKGNSKDQS